METRWEKVSVASLFVAFGFRCRWRASLLSLHRAQRDEIGLKALLKHRCWVLCHPYLIPVCNSHIEFAVSKFELVRTTVVPIR